MSLLKNFTWSFTFYNESVIRLKLSIWPSWKMLKVAISVLS